MAKAKAQEVTMSTNMNLQNLNGGMAPGAYLEKVQAHAHGVQFYGDDAYLLDGLTRFIGGALGAGDSSIIIATKAHRDGLAKRLVACGIDTAVATRQGRFVALDAAETLAKFMVDGWPDSERFHQVVGSIVAQCQLSGRTNQSKLAAFGEMVALLWAEGKPEAAIRLEQLWNELARVHSFHLHCAYPISYFHDERHAELIEKVCAEHSHVIPDETYTSLAGEDERLRTIALLQQKAQALANEVAERKRAQYELQLREAELTDYLENAIVGMHWVAADDIILWANKTELAMLGYERDEYIGHHIAEFHVDQEVITEILRRLACHEELHGSESTLRCKDGSLRHVRIHSNVFSQNGKFIHTRCFTIDVTEQKKLEETLMVSEKLASVGRLAATIAHEINNPLEAITNLLFLAQRDLADPAKARRHLQLATHELERVSHMSRQTLGFCRDNSSPVDIDVCKMLDELLFMYGRKLDVRKIRVEKRYDETVKVTGLESEIRQVFSNLIANAIDAMPSGGRFIVKASPSREWNNAGLPGVRITIGDTGAGIPYENRKNLFNAFYTTKKDVGTGLGLWLVHGIISKHKGMIHVRSKTAHGASGTAFSVFLPCSFYIHPTTSSES
jgi:PAS domain S-box-containing protein